MKRVVYFLIAALGAGVVSSAHADYDKRLSLGVGLVDLNHPSETDLFVGIEDESRMNSFFGIGGFGEYAFSSPAVTLIGLPEAFLHPFGTEWYVSGAPIVEFGSSPIGTHFGARLGTRVPIPLGIITLVPTVAVDFIDGGRDYILGLGIQF